MVAKYENSGPREYWTLENSFHDTSTRVLVLSGHETQSEVLAEIYGEEPRGRSRRYLRVARALCPSLALKHYGEEL